MNPVANQRDVIADLQGHYAGSDVEILVTGERPEEGRKYLYPRFRGRSSVPLDIGSNVVRHSGGFNIECAVSKAAFQDDASYLVAELANEILSLFNNRIESDIFFRNGFTEETILVRGFYRAQVVLDWFVDLASSPVDLTPTATFTLEYGIGRFDMPGHFQTIALGTMARSRYFRQYNFDLINTTTHGIYYVRIPNFGDTVVVRNRVAGTDSIDPGWRTHENDDGSLYYYRTGWASLAPVQYLGIAEIQPA